MTTTENVYMNNSSLERLPSLLSIDNKIAFSNLKLFTHKVILNMKDKDFMNLGFTDSEAAKIYDMYSFIYHLNKETTDQFVRINSPDLAGQLFDDIRFENREHFSVVYLDIKNTILHKQVLNIGDKNSSIVDTNEIVRLALSCGASSVIIGHNHPSYNNEPSSEDFNVTERIKEKLNFFQIELLDHLIVAGGSTFSFKQEGRL